MVKLHCPHQDTGSLLSYPLGVSAHILIARSALMPRGQSQDLYSSSFVPWLFVYCVQEMCWAQMFFLHLDRALGHQFQACQNPSCFHRLLQHPLGWCLWGSASFDRFAFGVRQWEPTLTTYSEVSTCVSWKHKASSLSIFSFLFLEKLDIW